jgi:hypothetical protein
LIVPSVKFGRRAISLFDGPSDTKRMIWCSRSVSAVRPFSAIARLPKYDLVR